MKKLGKLSFGFQLGNDQKHAKFATSLDRTQSTGNDQHRQKQDLFPDFL